MDGTAKSRELHPGCPHRVAGAQGPGPSPTAIGRLAGSWIRDAEYWVLNHPEMGCEYLKLMSFPAVPWHQPPQEFMEMEEQQETEEERIEWL